jgi:PAS domain S-box-containing protein
MTQLNRDRNRRVLVIDDNRSIHDDFRKILSPATATAAALEAEEGAVFGGARDTARQTQFEVDSAYQGQEGVVLAQKALQAGLPYAVAFVDVRMPPGMDGVETTLELWELDPDLQVVLCTAYSDYSWGEMFEKLGRRDGLLILKKPFDSVEALQLAQALTEKWWLHQQYQRKTEELEGRVAERTRELQESNRALQTEVAEHQRAEETLRKSEQQLRVQTTALDAAANAIVITDHNGTIQSVNPAFMTLTGYAAREVLGKNLRLLKSGKQDGAFYRNLWQAISSGQVWSGELTNRRKDGSLYSEEMMITPLRNADGVIARYIAIKQDITGRKRAEEKLKLFRTLIERSGDGIHVVDPATGRFLEANESACQALGYTRDELLALTVSDVVVGFDHAMFEASNAKIEKIGRATLEVLHRRKNGTTYPVEAGLSFVTLDRKYLVAIVRDITERKRAQSALQESELRYRILFEGAAEGIIVAEIETKRLKYANPAACRMLGYTPEEMVRLGVDDLHPQSDLPGVQAEFDAQARGEKNVAAALPCRRKDGTVFHADFNATPAVIDGRQCIVGFVTDVSEHKRLEARLFKSQKMETVGKLAGGIAHEFNSILTAILGQCELLLDDLPAGSPLAKNATEIRLAAGRAATLTRQLLAYGRKQILQPEALDLNRVIASMEGMIRDLMGVEVETQIVPAPGLHAVKADAGQIEQVIMNLAINARDAMPNGGKFTVEAANVSFDPESVDHYPELKPGDYVMLAITDTGAGMSEEVKAHLFEPFYSTKGVGQGTGLGLSTCYGIIKQSGGYISAYSEPGRGATFKIYLPQAGSQANIPLPRLDAPGLPRGTETILLVEDDPALREMAGTLLRRLGYTVLAAANGIEALSLKQQRGIGHIDLLFTDVVMPHMSGKELADRVRASHPHTRILFTSAYTENAVVHQGVLDKGVALLQKPFTPSALAHKLRELLDQPAAPKPDARNQTSGFASLCAQAAAPGN